MTTLNTARGPAPDASALAEPVVKCAALTKVFRDFWLRNRVRAVDQVDLDIRPGEVFGLLGPNGSGKSTTIKMILGLLHPSAGRIAVFGKRPEDVSTKKLIGYLPEESYLYRFLNARETLDYYGRLFHQSRQQRLGRIDKLLEYVGLEAVQRRPVGEYSKGMQRRIGIAQALINDPRLLILDEPTSGMDPIGTRQIKDLILDLKHAGKTILLCSHLLADVEDVCDRVAIMFGGKIRAQGTVEELLVRQDLTTLQTDALDVQDIEEIAKLLESRGRHLEKVEQPRQRLEALFLDVVQKAHAEGAATSGARTGGHVPEFLVQEQGGDGRSLIDNLVKQPAAAPASKPAATSGGAVSIRVVDDEVVKQLTQPKPATPAAPMAPKPAAPAADKAMIDGLVGSKPAAGASAPKPATPHGEKPDQSFIDALSKVDKDKNKPKPKDGPGASR